MVLIPMYGFSPTVYMAPTGGENSIQTKTLIAFHNYYSSISFSDSFYIDKIIQSKLVTPSDGV